MCIFILVRLFRALRVLAWRGQSARDSVVLVGSSNLSFWRRFQQRDLGGLPVLNRAVAGYKTGDVVRNAATLLSLATGPPAVVVYYAGSNDLMFGSSPAAAAAGVATFAELVPEGTRLIVLSSIASPDRLPGPVRELNDRCATLCALSPNRRVFVDVNASLEGHREYFGFDRLHLNSEGYKALALVVRPAIERELALAHIGVGASGDVGVKAQQEV